MEQVLIIGSGPAGLTAAIYASRSLLSPVVITGSALGGQAVMTIKIENYPGFPDGIAGMDLMELIQQQAERLGSRLVSDEVVEVNVRQHPFIVKTTDVTYEAKALIIATGVSPRLLGVPGEQEFKGRGLSYCAFCDAYFYRDKTTVVVGGGDSAVVEAIYLTRFAKKVYLVHRRNELRAQKIVQEEAFKNDRIEFVWDTVVTEVLGGDHVTGIRVKNVKTEAESVLEAEGMFSYIGTTPNTQLFAGQLELDDGGYIVTDRNMHTSVPGVFAAGDVQERTLKQVATAVGSGAMAAMEAEKFIAELKGHAYPERKW